MAAGFGGNLFGQVALNPAVRVLESNRDRGKVTHLAWNRYKSVNLASLAAMAGSWLIGRIVASGREVGRGSRALVVAKDVVIGAALASGVTSIVAGTMLDRLGAAGTEAERGGRANARASRRRELLKRTSNTSGRISVVLHAAALALTTVLAMRAARSSRWGVFSRLLP
jgi:hypothetical protein